MKEFELRRLLYDNLTDICHYSQLQISVTNEQQRIYCQQQIDERINTCINSLIQSTELNSAAENQHPIETQQQQPIETEQQQPRNFTAEELAYYDGSGGKPAYVAVNDKVYNVSDKLQWSGGTHFGLFAGKNLTPEFMGCHQGMSVILNTLPMIGVLIQ